MIVSRPDPFLGSGFQECECLKAGNEAVIVDYLTQVQLQHRAKDQGGNLMEFNLAEEGKEAHPIF